MNKGCKGFFSKHIKHKTSATKILANWNHDLANKKHRYVGCYVASVQV